MMPVWGPRGPAAERRARELRAEIERIREILARRSDIRQVILFGSAARGQTSGSSDIDLIIVRQTEARFMDRLDEMYRCVAPQMACDMLVYTPEEFERMKRESRMVARAVKEGKLLHAA
jgi:predicted nucleotidyltransferase